MKAAYRKEGIKDKKKGCRRERKWRMIEEQLLFWFRWASGRTYYRSLWEFAAVFPPIQTQKQFCTFHAGKQEGGAARRQNLRHPFGCSLHCFPFSFFLLEVKHGQFSLKKAEQLRRHE